MKIMSVLLAICLCPFSSSRADAHVERAEVVTQQARQARDKGDIETLQRLIRSVREEVTRTNAFDANMQLALFDTWLCEAARDHQDSKVVKEAAQDGVAAAERAVKLNSKSSEAHRLLGELLGELIPHVFAGGMRFGARSTEEIETAIQLDSSNQNAYVARGTAYFFTPKSFGGSQEKAVEMFKKVIATDAASDAAGTAHIWLATIYKSLGQTREALAEINAALAINPDRLFATMVRGQIAPA
jgi:tetratricopeptide (TPR) repeat protein